jgi:hypothetical protein
MGYGKVLAFTGSTGLLFGSLYISQLWLVTASAVAVLAAALAIRFVWRRNKSIGEV